MNWVLSASIDFVTYLLQNASHTPPALSGVRFLASFTKTCNVPFDDEFDFMLAIFLRLLPNEDRANEVLASEETNFNPIIISPRYVEISSNGSFYKEISTM